MNNKSIQKLIADAQKFMEENYHWDNYTNYIAVNVKLRKAKHYCCEDDIEEICDKMKLSEAKKEYIMEIFDNNHLNRLWESWVQWEAEYLHTDFLRGKCCISSQKWYDEEIQKKKDDIKEIKSLEKWRKKDRIESNYIDILLQYEGLEGFFGRMGGWYAILKVKALENLIEEIEYVDNWDDKVMFYYDLKELFNACKWAYKTVEKMKDGMDFQEEVKYRIEEALQDEGFIEDSETVNYAID